jgi:hypothetical protein
VGSVSMRRCAARSRAARCPPMMIVKACINICPSFPKLVVASYAAL